MKRVILIAAAVVLCSGAARAESGIDEVRAELRRAVAAGEVSKGEARGLMREAIAAHRAERHARRDAHHAERDARKAERDARKAEKRARRDQADGED